MSKLKADKTFVFGEECLAYKKSEADKVIAELKKEKQYAVDNVAEVINGQERELNHQKYKRCLAMAKWCDKYAFALELQGQGRSTELLKRHNRAIERKYKWLELADKFKECMNA